MRSTFLIAAWRPLPLVTFGPYAVTVGAVIITKDEDFVVRKMLESGPAVVWLRIGNTRLARLLRRLETHFTSILNAEAR